MNIESFHNLLFDFKSITPSEPYVQTFMDLSGYPHYENVCSNILAFYFDISEAHKMKDMLLLALCKSYDYSFNDYYFENVEVNREAFTSRGNKIDIVIENNKYIIAVENKIFHDVYNDLLDYSRHIDAISNGREKIKILLSLYKIDEPNLIGHGFKNITYSELFENIEEIIGKYILGADTIYLQYLFDLIRTIKRLERGTVMNSEFIRFLSDNEDDINRLLVETSNLRKEFRRKLEELSELIHIEKYHNVKKYFYKELFGELYDELYYEISISNDLIVYVDAVLSASGWYFEINPKKNRKAEYDDLIISKGINLIDSYDKGRKRIDITYDYDESLGNVAKTLQDVIDSIAI